MKKAELKAFKEQLLMLRGRLRGDITQMADAALNKNGSRASAMPIHMADIGSDASEQEFTLSLMENDEDTLEAIELALEKIEEGTFGQCDECEGEIAKQRLQAIPYASHCIRCATQIERR
ncbi:MAG: TraR/DksA family transcriptional regulator [Chloroflexi bacterium]|nr:TraR/DksA family transcriptional regulator [Chloroflexota bacterium]